MSTFDAVLIGALGMAALLLVLVGGVVAVWKVFPLLVDLVKSIVGLEKTAKTLLSVTDAIQRELAYMRALTPPPTPHFGGDPGEQAGPTSAPQSPNPPPPIPFPSPIFDRFSVVKEEPDATIADTDSSGLTQTDEDLVAMERLENLRQQGMHVEDSDTVHEGIEVDSE